MSDQQINEKVMRTLTMKYNFIVVVIEMSKDVSAMKIDELQSSSEARVIEIGSERFVD